MKSAIEGSTKKATDLLKEPAKGAQRYTQEEFVKAVCAVRPFGGRIRNHVVRAEHMAELIQKHGYLVARAAMICRGPLSQGKEAKAIYELRVWVSGEIAFLKYEGRMPDPEVFQLASILDIKRWEIESHKRSCFPFVKIGVLNGKLTPEQRSAPSPMAQIIRFPVERCSARTTDATERTGQTAQVIVAFDDYE